MLFELFGPDGALVSFVLLANNYTHSGVYGGRGLESRTILTHFGVEKCQLQEELAEEENYTVGLCYFGVAFEEAVTRGGEHLEV